MRQPLLAIAAAICLLSCGDSGTALDEPGTNVVEANAQSSTQPPEGGCLANLPPVSTVTALLVTPSPARSGDVITARLDHPVMYGVDLSLQRHLSTGGWTEVAVLIIEWDDVTSLTSYKSRDEANVKLIGFCGVGPIVAKLPKDLDEGAYRICLGELQVACGELSVTN